ncbi:hypothetical protein [Kineosporia sp. NBRC 101731]|uniref:hypothetical protein n=1 Tax=Kineosporia sp. NBRC 101731 TaxID=3032199 RepID=UPI0024A106F2|nr:hypothetical protein [Kineosporia sp. NBRC 101731]GLY30889.1 hypothetical protein Kisp02_42540 [Kineosporia sp. NBRC 101731]
MFSRPSRRPTFDPPPGWPVPPGGWRPEPGWAPDPSWPPAPDGWKLWKKGPLLVVSDVVVALVCFVVTLLGWALWMRLGLEPGVDYPVWRVVGLVLTLAVVGLPAAWLNWGPSVTLAVPLGLAVSAYLDWRDDETGLFVVGVVMVFVGSLVVTAVVAGLASAAGQRRRTLP